MAESIAELHSGPLSPASMILRLRLLPTVRNGTGVRQKPSPSEQADTPIYNLWNCTIVDEQCKPTVLDCQILESGARLLISGTRSSITVGKDPTTSQQRRMDPRDLPQYTPVGFPQGTPMETPRTALVTPAYRLQYHGPITSWWVAGMGDGQEVALVGVSTSNADYIIKSTNNFYRSKFAPLERKALLIKKLISFVMEPEHSSKSSQEILEFTGVS